MGDMMLRLMVFAGALILPFAGSGAVGKLVAADMVVEPGKEWNVAADSPVTSVEARGRLVDVRNKSRRGGGAWWGLTLRDAIGQPVVSLSLVTSGEGIMEDMLPGGLVVTVGLYDSEGNLSRNERLRPSGGTMDLTGDEYVTLSLSVDGKGMAEVMAGDERLMTLGSFPLDRAIWSVGLGGDRRLELRSVNVREINETAGKIALRPAMASGWPDGLSPSPADPRVGTYDYLDSDTDSGLCCPGGRYRLGVMADGAGGYDIVYLGGAEENGDAWRPGMIKGRLIPTIFRDHFNLQWIDAEMADDMEDLWCRFDGVVMELHFPRERGVMRFSRSPQGR